MESLKEQISDFRQSTPKHIQWLLLLAALVVVVILLTLVIGNSKKKSTDLPPDNSDEAMSVSFKPASINWQKVPTGEERTETVQIYATENIKISTIEMAQQVPGLTVTAGTCKTQEYVGKQSPCQFNVKYKPTAVQDTTEIFVHITYIPAASLSQTMTDSYDYKVTLGAVQGAKKKDVTPAPRKPIEKPEPKKEPEPIQEPEPIKAPEPIEEPVKQPVEQTQPEEPDEEEPEPVAPVVPIEPVKPQEPKQDNGLVGKIDHDIRNTPSPFDRNDNELMASAEKCSDFALPGYDQHGRQIGWIKPEQGAYYFHPFSDTNCDTPTGMYNAATGIITDIDDSSVTIGTDAEHIGSIAYNNGVVPTLAEMPGRKKQVRNFDESKDAEYPEDTKKLAGLTLNRVEEEANKYIGSAGETDSVYSSQPYDRRFILRQYKPIPATIVSEVRADPSMYNGNADNNIQLPVRATVDRNVYADNGRTVVIPTGTLMMGYVTGKLPGPYTAVGRMQIKWYQFILPNGVEFNFAAGQDPFSADSQGRAGVPGRGSTDYLEQFVMPMLTAIVPAAVNMIAPIADKFVNQIDLDNNTVVQSGTMRSSELAKNEIITAWNQVAQKLMVDVMDNTTPPFSIAAGTRITVYSPVDLIVTCGDKDTTKKCAIHNYGQSPRRNYTEIFTNANVKPAETGWVGQVREFKMNSDWCTQNENGVWHADPEKATAMMSAGYSFSNVEFYCQTQNYQAINNAKQEVYFQNQQKQYQEKYKTNGTATSGNATYNKEVLGLKYDDENPDVIKNPFAKDPKPVAEEAPSIGCLDGTKPDANGCCTGETFTDMGAEGWNCCPADGGDCFPPIL